MEFDKNLPLKELIKSLMDKNLPLVSNLSNFSSAIKNYFANVSWAGFYLVDHEKNFLYLGPYQGDLACTIIPFGKGVCGTSFKEKKSIKVADVNLFQEHIACSSTTKSELVVPIIKNKQVVGVIDLDSDLLDNFNESDQVLLEEISDLISVLF